MRDEKRKNPQKFSEIVEIGKQNTTGNERNIVEKIRTRGPTILYAVAQNPL